MDGHLFDEIEEILGKTEREYDSSRTVQERLTTMMGMLRNDGDVFPLEEFAAEFEGFIRGAHDMWWVTFGDEWFNTITEAAREDIALDSETGIFDYDPFDHTVGVFDTLLSMAKAEELLQNFLDMSKLLGDELENSKAIIEDRWVVACSGSNAREREAELRSYRLDSNDEVAQIWRSLNAFSLHYQEYVRRIKARLKFIDRYTTLGKESLRYKQALLPNMDMRWGRFRMPDGSWGLVDNQWVPDENEKDD